MPSLEELHLFRCPSICDECLTAIAAHCKGLRQLNVTYNTTITDVSVCLIADSCKALQYIGLDSTNISEAAVAHLVVSCSELVIISLSDRPCAAVSLIQQAVACCVTLMLAHGPASAACDESGSEINPDSEEEKGCK